MQDNHIQEVIEKNRQIQREKEYKKWQIEKTIFLIIKIILIIALVVGIIYFIALIPSIIRYQEKERERYYKNACEDLADSIVSYEWERLRIYEREGVVLPELEDYEGSYIEYANSQEELSKEVTRIIDFYKNDSVNVEDIDSIFSRKHEKVHYTILIEDSTVTVTAINLKNEKELASYTKIIPSLGIDAK